VTWLTNVKDAAQPLSAGSPIGVRRRTVRSGSLVPTPERHPYCEFSILLEGEVVQFWANQQATRRSGDIFLVGPGVPHGAREMKYPVTSIAIYFLPSVLVEMGPQGDGLHLLRRLVADNEDRCLVHPPAALGKKLGKGIGEFADEFDDHRPGRELRLRALLALLLTEFDRWETSQSTDSAPKATRAHWESVQSALSYLQENYAQPIYSGELANHLAMSESSVRTLFRRTLGTTWGKYLQTYRVHQAVSLLAAGQLNVTEVSGAVGFDSLNHFETTFRSIMGVTPREFARTCRDRQLEK
jgi:AraC family transcriptional regulator, arabinose operon regulatory protein